MFKNYLKTAIRTMNRHKGHTIINIAGLTMGIACFILIMLYVRFEMTYDQFFKHSERIYRVVPGLWNYVFTPPPVAPALKEEYPEIISIARISRFGISTRDRILFQSGNKKILENNVFLADPEIFDVLSYEFLRGDPKTALVNPNSIVMTEEMAHKYFGNEDPMGKTFSYENIHNFTVTGVLKNIPKNSHLPINFMIPFENNRIIHGYDLTSWGWHYCHTFCLLPENADIDALEKKSNALLIKHRYKNEITERNKDRQLYFFPITNIYLHPPEGGGPYTFLCILSLVAFFILIIACINYMNLTTARSVQRAREIGIRKVIGAQRKQLMRQLFSETALIAFFAFFVALIIVRLVLPGFNQLVERDLSFHLFENTQFILLLTLLIVVVSFLSGIYPALYISSFRPIVVIRGLFNAGKKGVTLKNGLVVFQFAISIILIFCTLVVRDQLNFIKNKETGFTKDQIVNVMVRDKNVRDDFEMIISELKKNPDVLYASASSHLPNSIGYSSSIRWPGRTEEDVSIHSYYGKIDFDFCSVYDIEIIKGRNFSKDYAQDRNGAFLINEAAAKALDWEDLLGREIGVWDGDGKIVGVMKNFHFQSFYNKIKPLSLFLSPDMQSESGAFKERNSYYLSVKIRANKIPETLNFIEDQMKKFSPAYPFEYHFFDDIFDSTYRNVEKTGKIFGAFASISIFIGCLGLFGLAAFMALQRTKEIGIRKVLGATVNSIIYMLSKEFVKWVILAAFFALPISWYAMQKWLQDFAFRINISAGVFALSVIIALTVALLTISYQSIKAATANPVNSLRDE